MKPDPHIIRDSLAIEALTPQQREELRRRLEEGYMLRNVQPGAFSLLGERRDWRTAIVLDACRYDVFAQACGRGLTPAGTLERRISPGSCTEDWIAATFDGRFDDVVYISASPYVSHWYLEQIGMAMPFAHLEEVWRGGWDDALHTVPPRAVAEAYGRLAPRMSGKKFILHFMQPHQPYIGRSRVPGAGWRQFFGAMETDVAQLEGHTAMELLERGKVDRSTVWQAYEANLELALQTLSPLLAELPRPVVITADHGEAFGECGIFGHPPGMLLPELIEVPYLVLA